MTTVVTRPLSSSISSQFQKQKPVEWISSLIQRYQDQLPTNTGRPLDRDTRQLLNTSHTCIINVSKHHVHLIVQALVRVLKAVNSSRWTSEVALTQSRLIVLQTLLECLNETEPTSNRNVERECCMKNVLDEMWQLISSCSGSVLEKATSIVARVGSLHSGLMLNRLETSLVSLTKEEAEEEQTEFALSQLNLMSNVTFNTEALVRILNQINHHWPVKKDHLEAICTMLSSVLWKWIEGNSTEFSSLQHSANCQMSEACDGLFLSMNNPEMKRRGICWPVQMLLIAVSPCSLESIAKLDTDQSISLPQIVITKRQFVDTIVSSVQSCHTAAGRTIWSSQLQYACHAAVNLCKCATYVNLSDFFVFNVVQNLIEHVKAVLLSPSRPREIERSVLVDCFVSLFRLKFDNDVFRVCLTSSQSVLQLVLVESLYTISTQTRLHWWPKIDMVMSRSEQLRVLLMSVIEKVLEHDPISGSSGHLPVSVSRSWQKMSGKLKAERVSASPMPQEQVSQQALLIAILKLVAAQPTLLIRQRGKEDEGCVESVVSALVLLIDHPNLHTESMQALLALHSVIPQWNSQSPKHAMQTFFSVRYVFPYLKKLFSSHMLFSVCQKLLHFQIPNAENVITWLKAILQYRIDYLKKNFDLVSEDLVDSITTQSLVKFEAVIFLYLWSCDSDLVLCCLSLFSLNSIHSSQISTNLHSPLSLHLSSASNIITAGRVALQKSLYKNLRTLPASNAALNEAWHESYRIWELFTNNLALGSKEQGDFIEHVTRIASYSYINSDLSQNMLDVWSNVSGFLCSTAHLIYSTEQTHVMNFLIKSLALLRLDSSNVRDVMCKNVKELISFEMDYSLDYFILHVISGQLSQNISNNRFVEHIIYILRNMLSRRATIVLKTETTIQMVSSLLIHSEQPGVRLEPATFGDTISTKSSGSSGLAGSFIAQQKAILLLKKMSGLFSLILDNVSMHKIPTQLQSRLVDFFINSLAAISGYGHSAMKSETVIALLESLTKHLSVMTISLAGGTFNRLFNLLIETFHQHDSSKLSHSPSTQNTTAIFATASNSMNQSINEMSVCSTELKDRLNDATLSTIANLVSGNLELGIARLIEVAWNGDPKLRRLILEAVSRVLNQKSSNSATAQAEVHAKLCELHKLITIITDEGTLPLVNSLINALPTECSDQLARVLVITFSEKHLLNELLWVILYKEAECSMSPSTLFRGSSLASKIIGYCFRVYGHAYLHQTLTPLFQYLQENPNRVYEIEQEKVPQGFALENTIQETKRMTELAFSLIVNSEPNFPGRLRSVCHALFHVINTRFPNSGLSALGKILFLRFFNPAIVSPYENQMMSRRPTKAMSRGLTLVSKILQATVNQSTLSKEGGMTYFQTLINEQSEAVNTFLSSIALNDSSVSWLESATLAPSQNRILLRNIHQLFSDHRCEIVSQLRLLTTHTNLCSRVDALLHALPEQTPATRFSSLSESGDSSLPPFYQINQVDTSLPTFVLVLRRVTLAEVESVKKYIDEKCLKIRFTCVIDCLLCEYPASLAKIFSTTIMPNIDKLIILFCSSKVLTQLNEPYFNKTPIVFESSSIVVYYDQLPNITLRLMTIQPSSNYNARLLASNEMNVTVKLIENFVRIERECQWKGRTLTASDVYACTAFEQIELINKNTITFVISENQMMSLHLDEGRDLVEKIFAMRSRNTISACSDAQIQIQANYEDVITLALVHIADQDVDVRTTAYKLLNFLISTLNLPIKSTIQDTPGIFVPSNCARFLTNIVTSLVANRPQLMLSLLPKIIHHGNNGLLKCLKDSWGSLTRMEKESLDEIFAVLIASSNQGPLSTLILNTVWPIIGQHHSILEHLLTHLLQSHIPLTTISEISQALVTESLQFSVVVIQRTIAELHASADVHIQKLLAMLLVISFNASNTIHDFHRTLSLFLQQLNSEETLRLFDVAELGDGQVIINEAMRLMSIEDEFELYTLQSNDGSINEQNTDRISQDENHKVPLSNVHQLISLLMAIVGEIEKNLDGGRQWISEWRATSKHWTFHTGSSQSLQIRSLIAYSCLANSVTDSDIRTTISLLLQVVKRRESLTSIAGVTLSLIRLHTLTPSNSAVHRLVFWIVILLFQLENAQIYEYGIQLLHANLVTLDQMGVFEHTGLEQIAMDARIHLEWDLKALDQYAGLSFRANFHFALIGYLLKGLRQPFLCTKVLQLIQLILRIIAKTNHCNPYVLSQDSLPYLLALLPFDEKVQQRFRLASGTEQTSTTKSVLPPQWTVNASAAVVAENPIINVWNEDEEEETAVLLDPRVIVGEHLQSLTVTVLAILARSCPNVHLVLDFLLEAVSVFPSVVPVIDITLICEETEDMWHVYNLIRVGDIVKTTTMRKVASESSTGSVSTQRIQMTLAVVVENIDFDPSVCSLHLKGKNVHESAHVKLGAYHTLDLELNRKFTLHKEQWDIVDLNRLDQAIDPAAKADVAAVVMHEGLAHVCLLTSAMTIVKAKIDMQVTKKRKGFTNQHDKSVVRFFDAVAAAFLRHVNVDQVKCILLASPGFLREQFFNHLMDYADKNGRKFSSIQRAKFLQVHSSNGFKHALKEVLEDPGVAARISDTKAQAEVKALNMFYELMSTDSARAFYGYKHVKLANDQQAIETLMVSDALFRSYDVNQRKKYVELVESVKNQGGTVLIFSSMHVSGEQLTMLTGVAAILRFPLPDIENEEMSDEEPVDEQLQVPEIPPAEVIDDENGWSG